MVNYNRRLHPPLLLNLAVEIADVRLPDLLPACSYDAFSLRCLCWVTPISLSRLWAGLHSHKCPGEHEDITSPYKPTIRITTHSSDFYNFLRQQRVSSMKLLPPHVKRYPNCDRMPINFYEWLSNTNDLRFISFKLFRILVRRATVTLGLSPKRSR